MSEYKGRRFSKEDQWAMAEWVIKLAGWDVMSTFTFKDRGFKMRDGSVKMCGMKSDNAQKKFEGFMRKEFPRVEYFYSIEPNPSRDGTHIHAVMAGNFRRDEMWEKWFHKFGRARVEPVLNFVQASDYVAKYIVKDQAWWNFKLGFENWQRMAVNPEKVLV